MGRCRPSRANEKIDRSSSSGSPQARPAITYDIVIAGPAWSAPPRDVEVEIQLVQATRAEPWVDPALQPVAGDGLAAADRGEEAARIGDPDNIRNRVLAFTPGEMLVMAAEMASVSRSRIIGIETTAVE